MFAICLILVVALLVVSAVSTVLNINFYVALGVIVGLIIIGAVCVNLINEKASDKAKSFLKKSGKTTGILGVAMGALFFLIGILSNGSYEMASYTNYSGGTTYYLREVVSALTYVGIIVAFLGAVLIFSSKMIDSADASTNTSNDEENNNDSI